MAGLRQSGFNDAMGRAGQAANLGFGAGQMDLSGRQLGQADRAQGLQAQQIGQGFNQLGMDARGLGANYAGMGLQAQNLGLGALGQAQGAVQGQAGVAGQLAGMGDYYRNIGQQGLDTQYGDFLEQRDWGARNLDILKSGLSGMPYGQTQSTPLSRNVGSGILGGAATGFGIGGPIGAGIGGLLGLFG
jgi:hypothetical protein